MEIVDARVPLLPGSGPLAAYGVIANRSDQPVKIVSLSAEDFDAAVLHRSRSENGQVHMQAVAPLVIAPGDRLELRPGADHIMLMGRQAELAVGNAVRVTLKLEGGRQIEHLFPVTPLP